MVSTIKFELFDAKEFQKLSKLALSTIEQAQNAEKRDSKNFLNALRDNQLKLTEKSDKNAANTGLFSTHAQPTDHTVAIQFKHSL